MTTRFRKTRLYRLAVIGGLIVGLTNPATGATPVAPTGEALPAQRVVVRYSGAMLNSALANEQIDRRGDVRDVILGTTVQGKSRTTGTLGARLVNNPKYATFLLRFDGVTSSRTTGRNGPAIIQSHSETTFSASRQIVFEPGKGFYGLPPKISSRTQLVVDGIDSVRGGLIGRVIRRVATRREAESRPQATEITRQRAEARVLAEFQRSTDERIAQVNTLSKYGALVATTLRTLGKGEPNYACSTTPDYLQFAVEFGEAQGGVDLAIARLPDQMTAPVEIWIHDSLLGAGAAAVVGSLQSPLGVEELMKLLAGSALGAGKPEAGPLAAMFAGHGIRTVRSGSWQIVHVEKRESAVPAVLAAKAAAGEPLATIVRKPPLPDVQPRHRTWTSGPHKADAEFLSLEGTTVRLRRVNGVKASIALEKLSAADQLWIKNELASRARSSLPRDAETIRR